MIRDEVITHMQLSGYNGELKPGKETKVSAKEVHPLRWQWPEGSTCSHSEHRS